MYEIKNLGKSNFYFYDDVKNELVRLNSQGVFLTNSKKLVKVASGYNELESIEIANTDATDIDDIFIENENDIENSIKAKKKKGK